MHRKLLEIYACKYVLITGLSTSNNCQGYGPGFCEVSNASFGNCGAISSLRNSHNPNGAYENANLGKMGVKACQKICEGLKRIIYIISHQMYKMDIIMGTQYVECIN